MPSQTNYDYFERNYGYQTETGRQLGNTEPGDGYKYRGRGLLQLTGRANYRTYGNELGVPLEDMPDEALDPIVSGAVLAKYFEKRGVADLARRRDWGGVRRAVNGGLNGWDVFYGAVLSLDAVGQPEQPPAPPTPTVVTYDPNTPPIIQDDPWSCAATSLRWALTALGRAPGPNYIEDLLVRDGVVSKDQGLLDASGAGLAAWIGKHGAEYYGDDGFYGNSEPNVTFDGVALEGDHQYPVLIGGRAWGHWTAVRGYDATRNVLLLANPADGWQGVGQTMSPQQFGSLGSFSMVRVLHPDLPGVGPAPVIVTPPPPAPNPDTRLERARALLVQALAVLDEPAA